MEISAKLVKQLREKTNAAMMNCKKALEETNGDLDAAAEYLRKKGLMDAAKKTSRVAADGLIAISVSTNNKKCTLVELNSETDFVAKNENFQTLAKQISDACMDCEDVDQANNKTLQDGTTISDAIKSLIALVGENITLRRISHVCVENGIVARYLHNAVNNDLGKIGVGVGLESNCANLDALRDFGKKIAMHIVAANPTYVCKNCVPSNVVDKERNVAIEQAKEMKKPDNVAEKIADGRVAKFFEEVVLTEQPFVMEPKSRVLDVISQFEKENNCSLKISGFVKFVLGEGIEKKDTNFAEEVQSFIR